jgi:hypothetical protein
MEGSSSLIDIARELLERARERMSGAESVQDGATDARQSVSRELRTASRIEGVEGFDEALHTIADHILVLENAGARRTDGDAVHGVPYERHVILDNFCEVCIEVVYGRRSVTTGALGFDGLLGLAP